MKKIISVLLATFLMATMISCSANPTNEDIEGVWEVTYTDENGDEISYVLMFAATSGDYKGVYSFGRDVNGVDDYVESGKYEIKYWNHILCDILGNNIFVIKIFAHSHKTESELFSPKFSKRIKKSKLHKIPY